MDFGLKDKVALITGAASGLGYVLAQGLAREGVKVMLTDMDGEGAVRAAKELSSEGTLAGMELDVSDDEAMERVVAETAKTFGGIDILVNNAGLARGRWQELSKLETAEWARILHVNVASLARMAYLCRPHMIARGGGVIVNQSSNSAYFKLDSSYAVTKLAVSGLTIGLAEEFEPDNIRVNGIAPGMMTGRVPQDIIDMVLARQVLKRRGQPQDLVGGLLYLCSDVSSFMTGQTLLIDGGAALRV
jgi:NAD(P)-dependent dehydrogenase (short-subunit alcohol dehydrogenase family)